MFAAKRFSGNVSTKSRAKSSQHTLNCYALSSENILKSIFHGLFLETFSLGNYVAAEGQETEINRKVDLETY